WGHRLLYAPSNDFLFGLLWPYGDIIDVQGSKMYVNVFHESPSMRQTFRMYALNQVHEKSTTNLFKKYVKTGDVVVDLGANIGYFTLLAANIVGKEGSVYSFEPEPRNYSYLTKNIQINNYENVTALQKAVGEKTGMVKLFICSYDTGHHTIGQYDGIKDYNPKQAEEEGEYVEVEKVALDDFFEGSERPVNIIKMDVEGAEMLALRGMDRVIRESSDIKMFFEFFPFLIKKMGDSPEEFIRKLLDDYDLDMFVIGHDYAMEDYGESKNFLRIKEVQDVMKICKKEKDHVNLFLKKKS
ncbi:MAG: FkbM family methyltransferase, partial [Thermoplasmata archaeon]|nr:FkbM family methyltransferase [Thermoplasmata archaeon]